MSATDLPDPPTTMSPDGHEVWDWADRLSAAVHARARAAELRAQLARRACGDCRMWMSRNCPREIRDGLSGRSKGPSADAFPCGRYDEKPSTTDLRAARTVELRSIEGGNPI